MGEQLKKQNSFSKHDSMIVKGVAIILLMFHHCISESALKDYPFIDFFPFDSSKWPLMVCNSFKLCVGMFIFITGFGLFKSFSKVQQSSKTIKNWEAARLLKTLSGFWFVYILIFIISYHIDEYPILRYIDYPTKYEGLWLFALIDFLGISNLIGTPTLIGTWWYMSAVVILTAVFPLLYNVGEKYGYFLTGLVLFIIPRLTDWGYPGAKNAYSFILAFLLGMVFAKYDVFGKLSEFSIFKKHKIISDILLFFVYLYGFWLIVNYSAKIERSYLWEFDYVFVPLIVILFSKRYLTRIPLLNKILQFIGKHSLNVFLVHTFIRYVYQGDYIYSFKYALLIPFVLLLISLGISVLIELVKKFIRYDKFVSFLCEKISGVVIK